MNISIITATLNSGVTIRDTLESVLNQKYRDIEHIIKDGGSDDETIRIVEEYRSKYEKCGKSLVLISEKDNGIYDAMNKGIAAAHGDVIGILNSDDFFTDDMVMTKIACAFDSADIGCCYGDLVFVSADTTKIVRTWIGSQHTAGAFLKGWHPAHPTFYARKDLFLKFGGFDTTFNVSADFELMLRFIEKGETRSTYIPHTLVCMRMGGESTNSIRNIIEGNRNILKAFRKNGFKVPRFYIVKRLTPKVINILKNKFKL